MLPVRKNKCGQRIVFLRHMYKVLLRILFLFDPEKVHYFSMNNFKALCRIPIGKKLLLRFLRFPAPPLTYLLGIEFPNKIGLGAGFDKNALYLDELTLMGFGFIEIGTVTPLAQTGNDQPRLFRLSTQKALINRMGFNNDGADLISERLREWRKSKNLQPGEQQVIIGGNIGKNKGTPNEMAWQDYEICFDKLYPYVDYFVVNVSSPNTPGLRELQEKDALKNILTRLQSLNARLAGTSKPILLKIAPDLSFTQINDVIDLAQEINLDGLVVSNTTLDRSMLTGTAKTLAAKIGAGGLSGKPLREKSTELIAYIHKQTHGSLPIIASGGVFCAGDAREKLNAGASLVQVWTGFIYEGPAIVKNICMGLN